MKKVTILLLCVMLGMFLCSCGFDLTALDFGGEKTEEKQEETSSSDVEKMLSEAENGSVAYNADGDGTGTQFLGYVNFGYYPQTIAYHKAVNEMSAVVDETGYYFSTYDNEHYAKVAKAKVYGNKYKFTDDDIIKQDNAYYFKVEPIKWKVFVSASLKSGEVQITMISDTILDSYQYCSKYEMKMADSKYYRSDNPEVLANNWSYSDLRTWLNDDFLNNAFSKEEQKKLIARTTSSVNKAETHNKEDDSELIWVPSYLEASVFSSKRTTTTDYARVRNTFMSIYDNNYGNGRYWTTTAGNESYKAAYIADYAEYNIDQYGKDQTRTGKNGESVGAIYMGVRPVISVLLTDGLEILTEEE